MPGKIYVNCVALTQMMHYILLLMSRIFAFSAYSVKNQVNQHLPRNFRAVPLNCHLLNLKSLNSDLYIN